MTNFKPVTHVIFDMDGLLLDSENIYEKSNSLITEKYGKAYTYSIKMKVMGKTYLESSRTIVNELNLPMSPEEYCYLLETNLMDQFPSCELLPGVDKFIRHLHANKIPIAIATSSKHSSFLAKTLRHQDFIGLFNHVVCGSDDAEVKASKPAPDTFLVCAQRFPDCPSPDKILVFEDSLNGVQAAKAANMQVVMIPDLRLDPKLSAQATLVLKSMEDIKPELFGLPPF